MVGINYRQSDIVMVRCGRNHDDIDIVFSNTMVHKSSSCSRSRME